jgi:hypothetical protein
VSMRSSSSSVYAGSYNAALAPDIAASMEGMSKDGVSGVITSGAYVIQLE